MICLIGSLTKGVQKIRFHQNLISVWQLQTECICLKNSTGIIESLFKFFQHYEKQLLSIVPGGIKMHLLLNEFQFKPLQFMELFLYQQTRGQF